jgi:hypothetical protein
MFRQQIIKIHNGISLLAAGEDFGTFELEMEKVEITDKPTSINIMLDKSGSMDDECEDGNTKMKQIIHVVTNMIRYISSNCLRQNVRVIVKTFNSEVQAVINDEIITEENLPEMIGRLRKIYPEDSTNIECALKALNSGEESNNIFMSDGDANFGETRPEELAKLMDTRATNYVVGFGLEHNPKIFAALSNIENGSYYFVDKIEKSATAYGEILHGILHGALRDVKITIENGMIYDWKTNEWTTEIFVGRMSGEMKKTFHFKTTNKEEMEMTLRGHSELHGEIVYKYHGNEGENHDLTNMFYRHRTQEILHKVKKINEKTKTTKSEIDEMKKEMKVFMAEMMDYMKKNVLTEDRMMKNLCDDIVVVYRTLGTEHGFMYSCARQQSNGAERSHNASDTPMAPRVRRQRHARFGNFHGIHTRQCSVMPAEDACEEDNDNKYSLSRSSNEDNVFGFMDEQELYKEEDQEEDEFEKLINNHEMSPMYCSQDVEKVINSLNEEENA